MQRMESAHRDQPDEDLISEEKLERIGRSSGEGGGECRAKDRLLITSQYPVVPTSMGADRIRSG